MYILQPASSYTQTNNRPQAKMPFTTIAGHGDTFL
jgi:hypothetical protein